MSTSPLILLHGALGDASQFSDLVPLLDRPSHSFNLRGHGSRDLGAGPFGIDGFCEDLLAELDRLGCVKADLLGYSLGGYVAIVFAMRYPDRVGRVFTLATKFLWSEEVAIREVRFLDPDKIEQKVPAFKEVLEQRHSGIGWRALLNNTATLMLELGRLQHQLDGLEQLQLPVRVVVGDRDQMARVEDSYQTFLRLPQAEFQVLPGCEHAFERMKLTEIAAAVQNFLGAGE